MIEERPRRSASVWPSDERLVELAGEAVFTRGLGYVERIRRLKVDQGSATATVTGSGRYSLAATASGHGRFDAECTCPHYQDGNFCKHLVAVAIAARESASEGPVEVHGADPITRYIDSLEVGELRALLLEAADSDETFRRSLAIRASVALGGEGESAAELKGMAQAALRTGGFVDYGRSFAVAQRAGSLLDELEGVLDVGGADSALPALLKSVTRLRAITLNGDDSAGVLGDQCQRAAELYARACREGTPNPVSVAKWLVKFRDDSPGWPDVTLGMFVDVFDEKALASYRTGVAKVAAARQGDPYGRFEVRRMLLELADHDHDLNGAIALLSEDDGHEQYGAIIQRCKAAGRDDLAARWLDRALAAGAVQLSEGSDLTPNDYRVGSLAAAYSLREDGRIEEARDLLRGLVTRHANPAAYRDLLAFADEIGEGSEQREWALAELTRQAERLASADSLIEVLLDEEDVSGAKEAADRYGCVGSWSRLSEACSGDDPGWVADRQLPRTLEAVVPADTRNYPAVARSLADLKKLYEAAGRAGEFNDVIGDIRSDYGRRPSLMKALDKAGL